MYRIYKEFSIDCAHRVVGHKGKCDREHGHTYRIEVWLSGFKLDELGILVDFGDIKDVISGQYDHKRLNDFPKFDITKGGKNPTAEVLARTWYDEISSVVPRNVAVDKIRVWETATAYAEWVGQ